MTAEQEQDEIEDGQATAILARARELIRRGWCQGVSARNEQGKPINHNSPEATQFCVLGALYRATGDMGKWKTPEWQTVVFRLYAAAEGAMGHSRNPGSVFPSGWNDASERTQEDVLRLFDRAIGRK